MTKTALRKKIVDCVEQVQNEKILEAVYTLLNEQSDNNDYEISAADWKIIEASRKVVLNGEEKLYTAAQVKRKLLKDLGK